MEPKDWEWLADVTGPFDEDFVAAVEEAVPEQERLELDDFE